MHSKILRVLQAEPLSPGANSYETAVVTAQRIRDENGAFSLDYNKNPGTHTGTITQYGRLHEDAPFVPVFIGSVSIAIDLSDAQSPSFILLAFGIPIPYQSKWVTTDDDVSASGVQVTCWHME